MKSGGSQKASSWMSALSLCLAAWITTSCSAISMRLERDSSPTLLKCLVPANSSDVLETPLKKEPYSAHRTVSFTTSLSKAAYQDWVKARFESDWHFRTEPSDALFATRLFEGEQQTIAFAFDVQTNGENHVQISFTAVPT